MKRLAIHILIVLILCGVFCDGYFTVSQLSCGRVWLSDSEVYAADGWEAVTQDDLVTAFQYYCKSRNLTIDGSIADALTSFTTTTFNNICNTLGIDVNALQANLKKTVEGNLGLRFLMNHQGVLAFNRIFAEFLQNNDLAVGDENVNKTIYSGKYFTDGDGINSLVYITNNGIGNWNNYGTFQMGTTYRYTGEDLFYKYAPSTTQPFTGFTHTEVFNLTESIPAYSFSCYIAGDSNSSGVRQGVSKTSNLSNGTLLNRTLKPDGKYVNYYRDGNLGIVYDLYTQKSYLCIVTHERSNNRYYFFNLKVLDDPDSDDTDITVSSPLINNNTYNNNWTIIYNDGDTYINDDDDEPLPTTPPDGGGGGGGDDPDQPSPSGPDLPDWKSPHGTGTIGSDGTFDFDIPFSLPDLNIDWSLKNIGQKFPFCIPSDIVSFYQVLAVEPEAPSIDAHIPLGSFYDWHFQADFAQYDNWARIIRIVEYVGFVITLIYFTVKLVKG